MKLARWIFWLAGLYGLLVVAPLFFMERQFGEDYPPAITHAEFFYGFAGVALAWQVAFLIIARDPARYRPLMPACMLEKFSFAGAALVLSLQGRLPLTMLLGGIGDFMLGVLFVVAWLKTPKR